MPPTADTPDRQDPYALLGVDRAASTTDIVRAFRVLARGYHPDLHPGDAAAVRRFRELAAAYQLLGDPARRAAWDQAHPARRAAPPPSPTAGVVRIAVRTGSRQPDPPLRAGPVHHTPPAR